MEDGRARLPRQSGRPGAVAGLAVRPLQGRPLAPWSHKHPAELGQESQASSCLRKGTPLASRVAQGGLRPLVELCVDDQLADSC